MQMLVLLVTLVVNIAIVFVHVQCWYFIFMINSTGQTPNQSVTRQEMVYSIDVFVLSTHNCWQTMPFYMELFIP